MPLLADQVHIISQEAEAQEMKCPLLLFQKKLSVDVLVVEHVHVVLVGDDDDVSSVSDLC